MARLRWCTRTSALIRCVWMLVNLSLEGRRSRAPTANQPSFDELPMASRDELAHGLDELAIRAGLIDLAANRGQRMVRNAR